MDPFASSQEREHGQSHHDSPPSRKEEQHREFDEKKDDHSHAREPEKLTDKHTPSPPSSDPLAENQQQQIKKQDSSSTDKQKDNIPPSPPPRPSTQTQQQKSEKSAPLAHPTASSAPAAAPSAAAAVAQPPPEQQAPAIEDNTIPMEDMVEMGGGLPALPPRPVAPVRQQLPQASSSEQPGMAMRVPQIKAANAKPQWTPPAGSDLGTVGKIGVFQIAHAPHAAEKSAALGTTNTLLVIWVYLMTFFVTFVLIKRK